VNTYETRTYKSVSPENKLKIEQGIIGVGMSIEECKASSPSANFLKSSLQLMVVMNYGK
jgi:hypothetical protein